MERVYIPKRYRNLLSLLIAIITLSLAVWSSVTRIPENKVDQGDLLVATSSSRLSHALVTEVIDGDTIRITSGKVVRYIGIDTPETKHPNKPVECFGKEASLKNIDLVLGREVTLVQDVSDTDRYGRLLRYVYVGPTLVNEILVKEGYAYAVAFPPDIQKQDLLIAAQQEAQKENLGLWNTQNCPQ